MTRYVLRRLLQFVPVLVGTTFVIYTVMWALPGDPFAGRCGGRSCPQSYVDRMTEIYQLDEPLLVQYAHFMINLVTGDVGTTLAGMPVATELAQRVPTTAVLASLAIVVELVLGVTAGVLAALRPGGALDHVILAGTLLIVSVPAFVLALVAQTVLAVQLGWFPVTSDGSIASLILPAVVVGGLSFAFVARVTRSKMIESLQADHVRTAAAKGLAPRRVVVAHGLRNSLVPIVTLVSADLGVLLGGTVVVEMVFNINGVGGLLLRSVRDGEIGTVTVTITLLVLAFLVINLLIDLAYPLLDPRLRDG